MWPLLATGALVCLALAIGTPGAAVCLHGPGTAAFADPNRAGGPARLAPVGGVSEVRIEPTPVRCVGLATSHRYESARGGLLSS